MLLWAGLGNPEPGMARHRHNIGFMAIDEIARQHGFGPWRQRLKGLTADGTIAGARILALKPMTYMNDSGRSIQAAAAFFRISPDLITVFHDELDLVPGKVRVRKGGGSAGHNGLRSTERMLATADFWRVRLGIGHPGHRERVMGHVLGDFSKQDQEWLPQFLQRLAEQADLLAENRPEEFMTQMARGSAS